MVKTKSKTRNQIHYDNASSKKKVNTGGVVPWSDLNHHVLYLVMMQLGVVDYFSFGGVCKSWRSLAISNRNMFIASKPPMTLCLFWRAHKKACYLEDFEGRKFKTILPRFAGGFCVGLTCGYLIFFKMTNCEFWLVNPITRHELHFPEFPGYYCSPMFKSILVYSQSESGWVFVVMRKYPGEIWFSLADEGDWYNLSYKTEFVDLHAFKGKLYILCGHLCELTLYPEPKLTSLKTTNFLKPRCFPKLVSSGENLYVMEHIPHNGSIYRSPEDRYRFQELDFGEMKWVSREKTVGEYASFLSDLKHGVVVKHGSYETRREGLLLGHNSGDMLTLIEVEEGSSKTATMWYFPHECLNVDLIDE